MNGKLQKGGSDNRRHLGERTSQGKLPKMEEEKCFVVQSDRIQTCRERGAHAQTTI
jgi:hypothetical protein